jgi:hypothetical protein
MFFAGIVLCYVYEEPLLYDTFPDDFVWGAATAAYQVILGLYSETRFHSGIECNLVCSWRRPNCRSQVIDLSLSALIS